MSRIVYIALLVAAAPMSYAQSTLPPQGVPEVGGAGALVAIGLLAGVVAVIAEIRRRK